jgi:predicted SAM-dependent methyltransferase
MRLEFEYEGSPCVYDTDACMCYVIKDKPQPTQSIIAEVLKKHRQTLPKSNKLNIGCGFRPFMDYINLDYDENVFPDVIRNVDEGLPFDSNKFSEVYSSHVIEHVKDVFFFISEIWRVSKNKGKITILCPYAGFLEWAIQPDHVRLINYNFFDRWRPEHISVQNELKQTRGAMFNIISKEIINEGKELKFILEVVK